MSFRICSSEPKVANGTIEYANGLSPPRGQPAGNAHHVGFRHSSAVKASRKPRGEVVEDFEAEVARQQHYSPVPLGKRRQPADERVPHGRCPSICLSARFRSLSFGGRQCHSGSSSMHDTPLPLTVCATTAAGREGSNGARESAATVTPAAPPL
jgi:hypothetical protein